MDIISISIVDQVRFSSISKTTSQQSNWILANGTWNDDGIWIDTETWRDN